MWLPAFALAGLLAVTAPALAQTAGPGAPTGTPQVGSDGQPVDAASDALAQVPPDQLPPPPPNYAGVVIGGLVIGGIVTGVVVSQNHKSTTTTTTASSASP